MLIVTPTVSCFVSHKFPYLLYGLASNAYLESADQSFNTLLEVDSFRYFSKILSV